LTETRKTWQRRPRPGKPDRDLRDLAETTETWSRRPRPRKLGRDLRDLTETTKTCAKGEVGGREEPQFITQQPDHRKKEKKTSIVL